MRAARVLTRAFCRAVPCRVGRRPRSRRARASASCWRASRRPRRRSEPSCPGIPGRHTRPSRLQYVLLYYSTRPHNTAIAHAYPARIHGAGYVRGGARRRRTRRTSAAWRSSFRTPRRSSAPTGAWTSRPAWPVRPSSSLARSSPRFPSTRPSVRAPRRAGRSKPWSAKPGLGSAKQRAPRRRPFATCHRKLQILVTRTRPDWADSSLAV